jgi:sec-independent protein translocase protein TatB
MNILGMGPAELLLIFVIALIVLGPGKLPQIAKTLGKAIRELRRMSLEVTAEFTKELRDMEAISREVKETTDTIKQAADIKKTLVESVEPAFPSTGPSTGSGQSSGQGSGHLSASESREEPQSPDIQETPTQVKAEKDTSEDEATSKGERD